MAPAWPVRCSHSGRGPRRRSGPGASGRVVTGGSGGGGPKIDRPLERFLHLAIGREGRQLAVPDGQPVGPEPVGFAGFGER